MSANTVESFLHKLGNDAETLAAFGKNREAILDRYNLSAAERQQILEWDLHAIVNSGVSPMALMFAYTAAHGGIQARDEYVRILREPPMRPVVQGV